MIKFSSLNFFQEVLRGILVFHGLDVEFVRPTERKITRKFVEKNEGRSLPPLHYNVHDKLADILHLMDALLFEPILLVK